MTSSSGNTPPPTSRNRLSTPPPPPRKPRRAVRKRRRPPRDNTPPCIVCHRKRPLRTSGLCWSLECALQAAQPTHSPNRTADTHQLCDDTTEKLPRFLHHSQNTLFVGESQSSTPLQPQLSSPPQEQHISSLTPQFSLSGERSAIHEGERIDQSSSEEEIQRHEKDVDRGQSSVPRDESNHEDSENDDDTHQTDHDKEGIGT